MIHIYMRIYIDNIPLEPRVVHGGVLVEEPVQGVLVHLLRNSAHEDLSTIMLIIISIYIYI